MRILLLLGFCTFSLFAQNIEILELKYYLDSSNSINKENVYKEKDKFSDLNYTNTAFGVSNDTCWIYVKVKSSSKQKVFNVIEFTYPLLDYIYVIQYQNSKVLEEYLTGDMTNYNTRKIDASNILIPYELTPNEINEFIFKINSQGSLNVGMSFHSKDEYYAKSRKKDLILGIYYGAVLIMLLYNMVLYLMIKERVYLDYVAFHFFFLFLQLGLNGLTLSLFFQDYPKVNNYFILYMLILANYFSVVFALSFLDLKQYTLKLYYYFKVILMLYLIIMLIALFAPFALAIELSMALSMISVVSLLFSSIYILYRFKTTGSKFFVTAWSSMLIGVMLTQLQYMGFINMSAMALYGSQIGAFFELALLSFALAYRYNDIFVKLLNRESEIHVLNSSLQDKVNEQTMKLKLMIKELNHRVKNNFQVILTCLWAQKQSTHEASSLDALEQTTQRIYAISALHELLDVSDNVSIQIDTYINEILNSFKNNNIRYNISVKDITINYDDAVSLGLILNELLTNSDKYAFELTDEPCINVAFHQDKDSKQYTFTYSDNGTGFDVDSLSIKSGLGYDLIYGFTQKMDKAEVSLTSKEGMSFIVKFYKKVQNA